MVELPVDLEDVLARLATLEISTWSYQWEPEVHHLGPMAQDFHRVFGLGDDDRWIDLVDALGVSLAAIKGLLARIEELEERLDGHEHP